MHRATHTPFDTLGAMLYSCYHRAVTCEFDRYIVVVSSGLRYEFD